MHTHSCTCWSKPESHHRCYYTLFFDRVSLPGLELTKEVGWLADNSRANVSTSLHWGYNTGHTQLFTSVLGA